MREERLTERMRSWKLRPFRREAPDPKRMIDSVIRHLEQILNTRRGSAQTADDFGIPDFSEYKSAYPDSQWDLERAIRHTIQKYEPRLKAVRVKFIEQEENPLSVSFQITARLVLEEYRDAVVFESILGSDGKITIRH